MERVKVFISHSGEMGRDIAMYFENFFSNFENSIFQIEVAPRSIGNGLSWFNEITNKLNEAHICLCIVDRNFKESSWCSFEVGYFTSTTKNETNKKLFLIELPVKDHNARLRSYSHPLAQIQSRCLEKESIRYLLESSISIYNSINSTSIENTINKQLDNRWSTFENKVNDIIEKYVGVNTHSFYDKSINITAPRADYLKEELMDNIKFKLSECIGEGFNKKGTNSLGKVFISFPLRLLNHLNNFLKEAAGGTISITDQNFFETMWTDEIIDNVRKSIWTTNVRGSNARKLDNIGSQKKFTDKIKDNKNTLTRIFIINLERETLEELNELKEVVKQQYVMDIEVGCILESEIEVYKHELLACIGGIDFMILDDQFVYVTNTSPYKNTILSVKLLDNNQVSKAIRISRKINLKVKKFENEKAIEEYFNKISKIK